MDPAIRDDLEDSWLASQTTERIKMFYPSLVSDEKLRNRLDEHLYDTLLKNRNTWLDHKDVRIWNEAEKELQLWGIDRIDPHDLH